LTSADGPHTPDYNNVLAGPNVGTSVRTDAFGRDILSRIIWGGRISPSIGLISMALGGLMGAVLGLMSGYFGGHIDSLIMQVIDLLLAFPDILPTIGVMAAGRASRM
jgi:glutathione transport system permease protein